MGGRCAQSSSLYGWCKNVSRETFSIVIFAFASVFCIGSSNSGVDNTTKPPVFCSTNRFFWISLCPVLFCSALRFFATLSYLFLFLLEAVSPTVQQDEKLRRWYNESLYRWLLLFSARCIMFVADGEAIRPLIFSPQLT